MAFGSQFGSRKNNRKGRNSEVLGFEVSSFGTWSVITFNVFFVSVISIPECYAYETVSWAVFAVRVRLLTSGRDGVRRLERSLSPKDPNLLKNLENQKVEIRCVLSTPLIAEHYKPASLWSLIVSSLDLRLMLCTYFCEVESPQHARRYHRREQVRSANTIRSSSHRRDLRQQWLTTDSEIYRNSWQIANFEETQTQKSRRLLGFHSRKTRSDPVTIVSSF